MRALPPAIARLEQLLRAGDGAFVPGADLSRSIGIPMYSLSNFVADLRRRRPDLCIEGRRGHGYRLITHAQVSPATDTDADERPAKPAPLPRTDPLDLFDAQLAEIVRDTALTSGETVEATIARLVAYGVEVHRELVMDGENPLGLARPRAERQPCRRQGADLEREMA